ncbi:CPBP family intramembrane glutamic endopeptidase [Microbacterium sp. GCS4]|uniref:CPBP family intramembrane glutamic endopeptidase n=1 Tax=Microbacterium sp. GCS4 TaxID=1692239 RepID=UPI0009E2CEC5
MPPGVQRNCSRRTPLGAAFYSLTELNSAYEEVLWRLLLPRLIGGRTFLLSVGFGLAHLNSMPYGLSGVVLTAAFALTAHWIVRRSNGSIVPTIGAHIVADIVLLGMLLS